MTDDTGRQSLESTGEEAATAPGGGEELMEDLIDEVSIDGMCGVY